MSSSMNRGGKKFNEIINTEQKKKTGNGKRKPTNECERRRKLERRDKEEEDVRAMIEN